MDRRFRDGMRLMRQRDPQLMEDGFDLLRRHAGEYADELVAEFREETDPGLRCWLLELIGEARSERGLAVLVEELNGTDESLRSWAVRGLTSLDTREARTALYRARCNGVIPS